MWIASPMRLEPTANAFFGRLPPELRQQLESQLEYVTLRVGKAAAEPGDSVSHILLPLTCVLSVVTVSEDGASTMLALVGSEGLIGLPAFMSGRVSAAGATVCSPGVAVRLPVAPLQQAFEADGRVRRLVLQYIQAFTAEIAETAHCNRHHTTVQQLGALILRAQDKQGEGDLLMTHERLAGMLGVRRETVSHAAHSLQVRAVVDYRRGHVRVLDRPELERAACSCFQRIRRIYERVYLSGGRTPAD